MVNSSWGPRSEILVVNLINTLCSVFLGVVCVGLAIATQVTGRAEYALWVPAMAGAMSGMAMSADSLIARQYAVLRMLGDESAPQVNFLNRLPVGLGHVLALCPVISSLVVAETAAWKHYSTDPFNQWLYLGGTVSFLIMCAVGWLIAAINRPKFQKT